MLLVGKIGIEVTLWDTEQACDELAATRFMRRLRLKIAHNENDGAGRCRP